ncbi:bacteriophage coat protein B [Pseudogulbenkiania sp. NH8B]|uniref:major capsid protein n=1 Tax=Pseudogulbenkiania sp. (strain NH8B) TaxID=748280 RepID=UPI0002279D97|nr:major capsid protein [Pseudogulbenkiania sp. NH8B]BAK77087.1 bacteriophage coat protein B [Pseudogulbenkiania sp. NH8B]
MKLFNAVRKYAPVAGLMAVAAGAHAEVPAEVTTAITSAGTDAGVVGAAVLVVIIGIATFKFLRRAV